MSEILEANIFFFITGIAVIIFTILLSVLLYHLIKILRSLRRVVDRIEAGSEVLANDIEQVREYFTERSLFARFLDAILGNKHAFESKEASHISGERKHTVHKDGVSRSELKIKGNE